ncbi:MAG: hypothetical protein WA621_22000, partial [Candidatus Acidiferrum sp.]
MRVTNWVKASVFLAGLCLAGLPVFAQQQEQQQQSGQQESSDSLAAAAKKAREQQKTAPKPKKVYTDDDIKPRTDASSPAAQGSGAAADDSKDAAVNGAGGKSGDDAETTWRKRFADQRGKIATEEKELDILQREDYKAQVQYYTDPQKALMEQNSRKDIN